MGRGQYRGFNNKLSIGKHDIKVSGGELRYSVEQNEIYIHGIAVSAENRNKGVGSKLLNRVIKLSDSSGLPITLTAVPIRDSKMTSDELTQWYKKRGFAQLYNGSAEMRYRPKQKG